MNNFNLTALLAKEHRADLLGQAERYRRAQDAKAGSRRPPKRAKRLWLAAFRGHTARPVAVSEGIPLGTAKTRIRQGPRPPGAQLTDPNATAPKNQPPPAPHPQANRHDNHQRHVPGLHLVSIRLVSHSTARETP